MGGMGGGRPACALHLEILVGNPSVVCRSPSIRLNDGHGPPKRSGCHGEECRPTAYTARGGGGLEVLRGTGASQRGSDGALGGVHR